MVLVGFRQINPRLAALALVAAVFLLLLLLRSRGDSAAMSASSPTSEWTQRLIKEDNRRRCLARLGHRLTERVRSLMVPNRPVVFVDPPLHWNLGDTFIWEGTMRMFDQLGIVPDVICTYLAWPPLGNATKCDIDQLSILLDNGGTLVFHGGGNFGDLYYSLQEWRTKIIERFPRARVLFMPNDMHYHDGSTGTAAMNDFRRLGAHPDVHIIFRNVASIDKAQAAIHAVAADDSSLGRLADRLYLEPDAAFVLGDLSHYQAGSCPDGPTHDLLLLMRRDDERTDMVARSAQEAQEYLTSHGHSFLWLDWFDMTDDHVRLPFLAKGVYPDVYMSKERSQSLRWTSAIRTEMGRSILCHGRAIVTDRLHAFILGGLLMGKPVVYMDNIYQKTTALIDTWIATGSPEGCQPEFFTFTKAPDATLLRGTLLAAVKKALALGQNEPYSTLV